MENYAIRKYAGEITARLARGIHERAEHEIHTEHELFYLYEGTALLYSEYGQQTISAGTLVVIPAASYHRIAYDTSKKQPLRCTCHFNTMLGFESLIAEKITKVCFLNDQIFEKVFRDMQEIFESTQDDLSVDALLKSYLGIALAHIRNDQELPKSIYLLNDLVKQSLNYIHQNLSEDLSAQTIAASLHVSPSYLSQLFRREMSTPLHQYILQKRLILANKKIMKGVPAVTAASESGFLDYSNFYTQYKRRFGVSPSHLQRTKQDDQKTEVVEYGKD